VRADELSDVIPARRFSTAKLVKQESMLLVPVARTPVDSRFRGNDAVKRWTETTAPDVVKLWMETATPKEPPPTAPV